MNNNHSDDENSKYEHSDNKNLDNYDEIPDVEEIGSKPMGKLISELSIMAMQRRGDGLDLAKFSKDQVDKLLDTAAKNEDNAYQYHTKKLDVYKELESKKISASIAGEKTKRFMYIGVLVIGALLTAIIIIWKNQFFLPWLTFVTGSLGGFGIGKSQSKNSNNDNNRNLLEEDNE
ncbi:hypothetical protein [uncultured Chryseobacterium sp.]|uniref:hypothetical protein n=1 Tax=uncultured Chryseobacterium sp. TaxID=259322 RepID=UPI0025FDBC38|nr:hypothetical protein [uncultured Chryseobacterium sp.]